MSLRARSPSLKYTGYSPVNGTPPDGLRFPARPSGGRLLFPDRGIRKNCGKIRGKAFQTGEKVV